MSYAVAEKALQKAFKDAWLLEDAVVCWPDVPFSAPDKTSGDAWVKFSVAYGESDSAGYGSNVVQARRIGIVYVNVFSPKDEGNFDNLALCDKAGAIFEYKQFTSGTTTVTCKAVSVNDARDDNWLHKVTKIPFYWDDFIAT